MNNKRTRLSIPSIVCALAAGSLPALAQTQPADDDASANALREIVVTAQKRTQNLEDVPMSITAIGERTLEMFTSSDSLGYFGSVPGLSYQSIGPAGGQHGDRSLNIRGIAADTGANTVGFYVNETPVQFVDPNMFDMNRVEVLRGPQGTLYGASSMGGTIRVITNQPDTTKFGAKFDGSVSTTQSGSANTNASLMLNLPLVQDRLALRLVGTTRNDGGYVDNILRPTVQPSSPVVPPGIDRGVGDVQKDFNTLDLRAGRAALRFQATENLSITPSILHQSVKLGGDPGYKVIIDPSEGAFGIGSIAPLVDRFTQDDLVTHQLNPSRQEERYTISDLTVDYKRGRFSFLSSTSYFDRSKGGILDMSIIFPVFFGPDAPIRKNLDDFDESRAFTQEARVSYDDGRLQLLAGAYYQKLDGRFRQSLVDTTFNDVVFGGFPVVPNGIFLAFDNQDETKQKALFADATYGLTERLSVTAGVRYFEVDINTHTVGDGLFNDGPTEVASSSKNSGSTPRMLVSYKVSQDAMVYGTASKGFRPGFGLEPVGGTCDEALEELGLPIGRTQVDPDSLWNYEVGFKSSFLDRRLTLNAAAYRIRWSDIQQRISLGDCGFSTTVNGGKASSNGFEAEVAVMPVDRLEIAAGVSYVNAELTEDAPTLGAVKGDPILRVADWTGNLSGTYSFPIGSTLDAYAHADYQYTGPGLNGYDLSSPTMTFVNRRPAYDVINLRTGVMYDDWEFSVFVQNATDERPRLGAAQFITPDVNVYTIRPRTYGLNVRKTF